MSDPTVLPANFEDADREDLVVLIADMLQRLISHNDQIPLSPECLTRFHSRSAPAISVLEYLRRIVKYTNVERTCLLITLHYIDQICARLARFTISSLTVHRFILASVAVSAKALCDVFCTNTHYAKVGGIRVAELNLLEKEFLAAIDWRLTCTRELLQEYYVNLARTHSSGRFRVADPPPTSPAASSDVSGPPSPAPAAPLGAPASPAPALLGAPPSPAPAAPAPPTPPPAPPPTLEQNMAFAALRAPAPAPPAAEKRAPPDAAAPAPLRAVRRRLS